MGLPHSLHVLRESFQEINSLFEGAIEYDVPLAKFAYYQIGGRAEVLATPKTMDALLLLREVLIRTQANYFILGWGSNILFSDDGFPGVVIRMKHLFTTVSEVEPGILKLGASLGASTLLRIAAQNGYGGFEKLTGIPGSVGGMVAMNAGTHLGEFSSSLLKTEFVNLSKSGTEALETKIHDASDFSYRKNHFLNPHDLVTHTYARYAPLAPAEVKAKIDELYQRRKSTQPVDVPSCGSVFMNPKDSDLKAWQVVERLGLRGHQIGNAQISQKHPNFIVNLGQAKARDVLSLIDLVRTRARSELNIELEPEVKLIS